MELKVFVDGGLKNAQAYGSCQVQYLDKNNEWKQAPLRSSIMKNIPCKIPSGGADPFSTVRFVFNQDKVKTSPHAELASILFATMVVDAIRLENPHMTINALFLSDGQFSVNTINKSYKIRAAHLESAILALRDYFSQNENEITWVQNGVIKAILGH